MSYVATYSPPGAANAVPKACCVQLRATSERNAMCMRVSRSQSEACMLGAERLATSNLTPQAHLSRMYCAERGSDDSLRGPEDHSYHPGRGQVQLVARNSTRLQAATRQTWSKRSGLRQLHVT